MATQGGRPPDGETLRSQAPLVRAGDGRRSAAGDAPRRARVQPGKPVPLAGAVRGGRACRCPGSTAARPGERPATRDRAPRLDGPSTTYSNSRRIAAEFRRREVWPLSHGQVNRLLARHGTHRPSYIRTPGPGYERAAVNDLWHTDLKGPFFQVGATGRARTCHFVALVDRHDASHGSCVQRASHMPAKRLSASLTAK